MTKKDFQMIAHAIAHVQPGMSREEIARVFARVLQTTNSRFDADRFVAECLK